MNAIELLKSDHKAVERLFLQVEKSDGTANLEVFEQIKTELNAHAHIEETIFYPSLQEEGDDELVELVSDALKEHAEAKAFLGELDVLKDDGTKFKPLLSKLIEDVRHHVEEEEGEMFPKVENQFSQETIKKWGSMMETEKKSFMQSADSVYN